MKRILISLVVIAGASAALSAGMTGAFFSDTETSTGNTFAAGAIDLKVDNESFYNGLLNQATSWSLDDLSNSSGTLHKFFDFADLKPADYGEDTISLHVNTNDAYLCANVTLTSNDDNGLTGPEALVDSTDGPGQGELAQHINFIWWADDGDNVLESNETVLAGGNLAELGIGNPIDFPLADSAVNIWNPNQAGGPVLGNTTYHIGKAWCFGTLTASPLAPGDYAQGPAGDNNGDQIAGTPEDGGIICSGAGLGNATQTDSLTADVTFTAEQSRNNPGYTCPGDCQFDPNANLVSDGGFETPVVVDSHLWNIYPSPVDGWNVEWRDTGTTTFGSQTRPTLAYLELHHHVLGNASEGDQYAELDSDWGGPSDSGTGEPASARIYQDIVTIPGVTYTLHFAFAPRPNTSSDENELGVEWGGAPVATVGPLAGGSGAIAWTPYDFTVTATTTVTRLSFTDLGTSDSLGTFLDDVKLTQSSCVNEAVN